jgi:hypothetical protein
MLVKVLIDFDIGWKDGPPEKTRTFRLTSANLQHERISVLLVECKSNDS